MPESLVTSLWIQGGALLLLIVLLIYWTHRHDKQRVEAESKHSKERKEWAERIGRKHER